MARKKVRTPKKRNSKVVAKKRAQKSVKKAAAKRTIAKKRGKPAKKKAAKAKPAVTKRALKVSATSAKRSRTKGTKKPTGKGTRRSGGASSKPRRTSPKRTVRRRVTARGNVSRLIETTIPVVPVVFPPNGLMSDPDVRAALPNFQFQWNNASPGSTEHRWQFMGMTIYHKEGEYHPVSTIAAWLDGSISALTALDEYLHGQRHNGAVQQQYKNLHNKLGTQAFFTAVVCTEIEVGADFNAARLNIEWQEREQKGCLGEALRWYDGGDVFRALVRLLGPQSHNRGSMACYRACCVADHKKLFDIVREYKTT